MLALGRTHYAHFSLSVAGYYCGGIPKSAFDELCVSLEETKPTGCMGQQDKHGTAQKTLQSRTQTAREEVAATVRSKSSTMFIKEREDLHFSVVL